MLHNTCKNKNIQIDLLHTILSQLSLWHYRNHFPCCVSVSFKIRMFDNGILFLSLQPPEWSLPDMIQQHGYRLPHGFVHCQCCVIAQALFPGRKFWQSSHNFNRFWINKICWRSAKMTYCFSQKTSIGNHKYIYILQMMSTHLVNILN